MHPAMIPSHTPVSTSTAHPIPRVRVFHGIKAIATARASSIVQKVGAGRSEIKRLAEVNPLIIFVSEDLDVSRGDSSET